MTWKDEFPKENRYFETENGILYHMDNLELLKTTPNNTIDLVYIDLPFGIPTDKKFGLEQWKNTDYYDEIVYKMFSRVLNENDLKFLSFLRERIQHLYRVLKDTGSIYVHIDWHLGHYVKIILDDIFGKKNFINEIIWSYNTGGIPKKQFQRKHDNIYFYQKDIKQYTFNKIKTKTKDQKRFNKTDEKGRKYYMKSGIKYYLDDGVSITDVWSDLYPVRNVSKEQLNYPTQKPLKLLERVIKQSSNKDDIILDVFSGTGTSLYVQEQLNRKWIGCDFNKDQVRKTKERFNNK